MNNSINGACFNNNESMLLILVLLMVLCPGFLGGCGNDSFILIIFLLMFMPNMNRGIC